MTEPVTTPSTTPQQHRVHNRPVPLSTSKSSLKSISSTLKKRFDTKIGTLPDGAWAAIVRCLHEDKSGVTRVIHRVVGTDGMRQALEDASGDILGRHGLGEVTQEDYVDYLLIPGNAEVRAAKVRGLLKQAWSRHVKGTKFEHTKQMYKAVNESGAPAFPWWSSVTGGAPFTNTAVADPETSVRLAEHLGKMFTGRVETPATATTPAEPHEQCLRHPLCITKRGHRGKCHLVRPLIEHVGGRGEGALEEPPPVVVPTPPPQVQSTCQRHPQCVKPHRHRGHCKIGVTLGNAVVDDDTLQTGSIPTPPPMPRKKKPTKPPRSPPPPPKTSRMKGLNNRARKAHEKKAETMERHGFAM